MSLDVEWLIFEIKNRPIIWNYNLNLYQDKTEKYRAWNEIACVVCEDFRNLSATEQAQIVSDLQRKWMGVRKAYSRELKLLKCKKGAGAKMKKKYMYFDQLSFLETIIQPRKSSNNISPDEASMTEEASESSTITATTSTSKPLTENSDFEEKLLNLLKKDERRNQDSDYLFLCSLYEDFKKVPEENKHSVKIAIMNAIENGKRENRNRAAPSNSSNMIYFPPEYRFPYFNH